MRILYKFPSRTRPEKFFAHLDNIIFKARAPEYLIVPTLDENDASMRSHAVMHRLYGYYDDPRAHVAAPLWGRSTSKVHACNRDLDKTMWKWDIVVLTSDDMEILEEGFDLKIIEYMEQFYPDTDGVLHFRDGYVHGDILSWPVIGKKYYDRTGYIWHPSYQSLFCDEEALIVAQMLGKCISFDDKIIRHPHPVNTGGPMDQLYMYNEKFYPIDKRTFERRKANNFFVKL